MKMLRDNLWWVVLTLVILAVTIQLRDLDGFASHRDLYASEWRELDACDEDEDTLEGYRECTTTVRLKYLDLWHELTYGEKK